MIIRWHDPGWYYHKRAWFVSYRRPRPTDNPYTLNNRITLFGLEILW